MKLRFGILTVLHPSDFITCLGRNLGCYSILFNPSISGIYTIGFLAVNCSHGVNRETLYDLASVNSYVKEFEKVKEFNYDPYRGVFFMKKISFGTQKALMDLGIVRLLPIEHEVSGYKRFFVIYDEKVTNEMISLVKSYAQAVGERNTYVRLKPISSLRALQDRLDSLIFNELLIPIGGKLSPQEYQVLKKALELGYFDWPRKINIKELSMVLNLSEASIAEHIRRGVKKVLNTLFFEVANIPTRG